MKLSIALMLLLVCSACIQFGGKTLPQHYYLLAPQAKSSTAATTSLDLLFDQIAFPSYLDRPQLVTRNLQNQLEISDADRWGEPLQDNLVRVLKENLQRRLHGIRISDYPWQPAAAKGILLKLVVNQFDGVLGRQTDVDIRWSISRPGTDRILVQEHFIAKLPIGKAPQDLVSGLSQALNQLSAAISRELEQIRN